MKKVISINVDGVKRPCFEYQVLPTDGKRRRLQKRFLKQFCKYGLYESSCKYIKVSATTIKRWYEIDDWFNTEVGEAFEFAIKHYYEDLEVVPLNRRHWLFNLHRVKYEGKEVYDNFLEPITKDEYIDENGDKQLTELTNARIKHEEIQSELEQITELQAKGEKKLHVDQEEIDELHATVKRRHNYVEGDISVEEYMKRKEMEKNKKAFTS